MLVVRAGAETTPQEQPAAQVAHDAEQAAQVALRATVAAGNPLSGRQLANYSTAPF